MKLLRNLIIGTAGHVDHGKTEIIKALTGRDTDRLSEEKARGISIVLGFAPLDLGDEIHAGVVDVPGHERFVKNMVSGAVGVDLALLVVAADEGVMPQTEEHFEVLRLLGVNSGVVAITKDDLVDKEMVELVRSDVADLVKGSFLEEAPVINTSVVTGVGLDELRSALRDQARKIYERVTSDFFRMPVDRVFSMKGIGTIVTGTTWSGEVHKGDELVVAPGGKKIRVREVHSFDRVLDTAPAGVRAALAIHGVKVGDLSIGYQLLSIGILEPSRMLDVAVEVSTLPGSRLKNRQRIRFHHAAAEIIGRVVLLDSEELGPGDRGFVQLRLEKPAVAQRGDGFVIRSYSPMRVIGGGRILDPTPTKEKRFKTGTIERLGLLDGDSKADVVQTLALQRGAQGISAEDLRRYGVTVREAEGELDDLERRGSLRAIGGRMIETGIIEAKETDLLEILERFAARNRLVWGMEREELKEKMGIGDGPLFDFLIERGRENGRLFVRASRIRAGSGEMDLSEGDRVALSLLEQKIKDSGFEFPSKSDLSQAVQDEKQLASYLRILRESGTAVRISSTGYLHVEHFNDMVRRVREHLVGGGTLSVSDFKDIFGFSRKYAVPLLEYLDSEGFTRRQGDVRVSGPRLQKERS